MAVKKLKDWFDKELAKKLSTLIIEAYPQFNSKSFIKNVEKGVIPLELKARVEWIADQMFEHLTPSHHKNIKILLKTIGPENENETGMFTEFYWLMPFAKYVEKYGLDYFDLSMEAIEEITKRNTSEYALRPFIEKHEKETLRRMKLWSKSENFHLRRLASEGGRPRLPWAAKLDKYIQNPKPLFPILNTLKDDTSKYVQKSVANCINDIIKDNEALAITLLTKWSKNPTKERKWIIKHSLRKLIKKNNSEAIKLVANCNK